jgi:cyanophycinase
MNVSNVPKGRLLIIGGAEDKGEHETGMEGKNEQFEPYEILEKLIPPGNKRIEIITTASEVPDEVKDMYTKVFRKLKFKNIGFLNIEDKFQAAEDKVVERIKKAGTIMFSGGDQFRISTIIGGTPICELIRERYSNEKDFTVAGTSAGAMVLSRIMIASAGTEEALIDKNVQTCSGLGLLDTSIVDTHFIKRGRFGRLAHAVIINPGQLGIGLGEDTAMSITNGKDAECHGSGMVVIIDGKGIGQTNITDVEPGCPVFVEDLKVHLLVKGCRFSLEDRKLSVPAMPEYMQESKSPKKPKPKKKKPEKSKKSKKSGKSKP